MRMRKKKNRDERLSKCCEYLYIPDGDALIDPAGEVFSRPGAPVYLEIGAGKGGFALGMVRANPEVAYFALERVTDCVVLGAERAMAEGAGENLKFVVETADNLTRMFAPGTIDRIFLNFSDPWTKKGYAKRRLTHSRYLSVYMNLLKDGGKLRFKTDNVALFDFSLEEIEKIGITPDIVTRDLHASTYMEGNVVTEYEANFSSQGVKINMLEITKPAGFDIEIPADLLPVRRDYRKEKSEKTDN